MKNEFDQSLVKGNDTILDYLKKSRLFSHLSEEILQKLIPLSELSSYPEGTEILKEGQENDKVFFLIEGTVAVYAGGELILRLKRAGDIFGEMSIISHNVCSASVFAETQVHLFILQSQDVGGYSEFRQEELQNILYRLLMISIKAFR